MYIYKFSFSYLVWWSLKDDDDRQIGNASKSIGTENTLTLSSPDESIEKIDTNVVPNIQKAFYKLWVQVRHCGHEF